MQAGGADGGNGLHTLLKSCRGGGGREGFCVMMLIILL